MEANKAIESKIAFMDFVSQMEPNERYEMPESFRYKWIKIEKGGFGLFSWSAEYNFRVAGTNGYRYPLSGKYVQQFKTINGAKRSFVKAMEFLWKDN